VKVHNLGWWFILVPAIAQSLILVAVATLLNNLAGDRSYPTTWFGPAPPHQLPPTLPQHVGNKEQADERAQDGGGGGTGTGGDGDARDRNREARSTVAMKSRHSAEDFAEVTDLSFIDGNDWASRTSPDPSRVVNGLTTLTVVTAL
jgi:hypothetical protein